MSLLIQVDMCTNIFIYFFNKFVISLIYYKFKYVNNIQIDTFEIPKF